jgi:hypothetical protein
MDAQEALRIARLALAMHFDIEPDVVAGRYVGAYVAATNNKRDIDAAEAYNKLAEMQQYEEYKLDTMRSNEKSLLFMARYGTTVNE